MRNGVLILDARILVLDKDLKSNSLINQQKFPLSKKFVIKANIVIFFWAEKKNDQHLGSNCYISSKDIVIYSFNDKILISSKITFTLI